MEPQQDEQGWYLDLGDGERARFDSNAAAWRWLDRHERRETWVTAKRQFRQPAKY